MYLFLSIVVNLLSNEARSIDPTTAWAIIAAEGSFIATLVTILVAQQKRHGKRVAAMTDSHEQKVTSMGEKINTLYDKRIEDMKGAVDLVKTIEAVVYKERKGGK